VALAEHDAAGRKEPGQAATPHVTELCVWRVRAFFVRSFPTTIAFARELDAFRWFAWQAC